jgi:hypothetical protein
LRINTHLNDRNDHGTKPRRTLFFKAEAADDFFDDHALAFLPCRCINGHISRRRCDRGGPIINITVNVKTK